MSDLSQHPGEQVPAGVSMESSAVSDREQVSDKPVCTEADFPIGLCDILKNLSQFFSLELGCLLLPCLAVVGAAVANWARARSQIWPTRINSALQLVICDEEPNRQRPHEPGAIGGGSMGGLTFYGDGLIYRVNGLG